MEITKWYVDCVGDDGEVCIAYWLRVATRAIALTFVSTLLRRDGTLSVRSERTRIGAPQLDGDTLRWRTDALELEMHRRAPAVSAVLLDDVVQWRCELPSADVRLRIGDKSMQGRGYAEVLQITGMPWRLPIEELRWGRFTGEQSSVVWIDWRGPRPLTLVAHDGRRAATATVEDDQVSFDGRSLTFADPSVIRDGTIRESLQGVPLLGRLLPERFTSTRECKWMGTGTLEGDAMPDRGWCVYETVRFA